MNLRELRGSIGRAHKKGRGWTRSRCRRDRYRSADAERAFPPLVRTHAQSISAGGHAGQREEVTQRIAEHSRGELRARPVWPRPSARSLRRARSNVARRMENRRRGPGNPLRISSVAVRHRARHGDKARALWPRLSDPGKENAALKDMRARWKNARYVEDSAATADIAELVGLAHRRHWRLVLVGDPAQLPAVAKVVPEAPVHTKVPRS